MKSKNASKIIYAGALYFGLFSLGVGLLSRDHSGLKPYNPTQPDLNPKKSLEQSGATEAWLNQVMPSILPEEYLVRSEGDGYVAVVPSGLRADFSKSGEVRYTIANGTSIHHFQMRLAHLGRAGQTVELDEPTTEVKSNTIFFHHEKQKFSESYANLPVGIEQSVLLSESPVGKGKLTVSMKLKSDLKIKQNSTTDIRFLSQHEGKDYIEFAFNKLIAKDASGRVLSTEMKLLSQNELTYIIDDKDAQYPLMIDPIVSAASWTYESNQVFAHLGGPYFANPEDPKDSAGNNLFKDSEKRSKGGIRGTYFGNWYGTTSGGSPVSNGYHLMNHNQGASITGIGDVNGDGWADVAVAAPYYEYNSVTNAGVVFIFHGSSSGLPTTPTTTLYGNALSNTTASENAMFGSAVANVGDFNGDGYSDVAVTAPGYDRTAVRLVGSVPCWIDHVFNDADHDGTEDAGEKVTSGNLQKVCDGCNGNSCSGKEAYSEACDLLDELPNLAALDADAALTSGQVYFGNRGNCHKFKPEEYGFTPYDATTNPTGPDYHAMWVCKGGSLCDDAAPHNDKIKDYAGNEYYSMDSAPVLDTAVEDDCLGPKGQVTLYLGSATGLTNIGRQTKVGTVSDDCSGVSNLCEGLGNTVAGIGDVNNDGYSDFAVGWQARELHYTDSIGKDVEVGNAGEVKIYLGDAAGTFDPAWMSIQNPALSSNDGGHFGSGIAGGDVNGDGYSDLLIAADHYEVGTPRAWNNEGKVYLYDGYKLAATSTAVAKDSEDPLDQCDGHFGDSIQLTDLNGDGYADFVIGAKDYGWTNDYDSGEKEEICKAGGFGWDGITDPDDPNKYTGDAPVQCTRSTDSTYSAQGQAFQEGRVYIYSGGAGSVASIGSLIQTKDPANQDSAFFGQNLGVQGDLDGDGLTDLGVGARGYGGALGYMSLSNRDGRLFIYKGAGTGGASMTNGVRTPPDAGTTDFAEFGRTAFAGDVNGDGKGDLLVAAATFTSPGTTEYGEGKVYLYNGGNSGLSGLTLAKYYGPAGSTKLGEAAAAAAAANNDQKADVLVGSPSINQGRVDFYLGANGGPTYSTTIFGAANGDRFGAAVARVGDYNGDGYEDYAVGAPLNDAGGADAGALYIYKGANTSQGITSTAAMTINGTASNQKFGSALVGGDFNGDGLGDVAVAVPGAAGGQSKVMVYYAASGPTLTLSKTYTYGDCSPGMSLASGNTSGDKFTDLVVTCVGSTSTMYYYKSVSGTFLPTSATSSTTVSNEKFGASMSMTDYNGDGYDDLIVGAPLKDNGQTADTGGAYLYNGSSTGLSLGAASSTFMPSSVANEQAGTAVIGLGDVDGDGYNDIAVTLSKHDSDKGKIVIGYGPSFSKTAPIKPSSLANSDAFGASLGAGDFNGDGYADLFAGAPGSDTVGGLTDAGALYAFPGGDAAEIAADGSAVGMTVAEAAGADLLFKVTQLASPYNEIKPGQSPTLDTGICPGTSGRGIRISMKLMSPSTQVLGNRAKIEIQSKPVNVSWADQSVVSTRSNETFKAGDMASVIQCVGSSGAGRSVRARIVYGNHATRAPAGTSRWVELGNNGAEPDVRF